MFNNIANIYHELNEFTKSLEYYKKSLKLKGAADAEDKIAITLCNIVTLQ
ncbi:MAG: tetratricopeptide repeat protein [Candidatus Cloacimonetes bacterium]|nr:tetratricopeptide repeat protein [Candidatus Cloacimonadota bacterium]